MKIRIVEARKLAGRVLEKFGLSSEEANFCIENCLEGELTGKKSHGFVRIVEMVDLLKKKSIKIGGQNMTIVKETAVSILIDGQGKPGVYLINKALLKGIEKVKSSGMCIVGVANATPMSGIIGQYARIAAENDLIFIGFNNSDGGLIPHGAIKDVFGTNPLTVGVPTHGLPVILDMASSKMTWGEIVLARKFGRIIPEGVALDGEGNPTNELSKIEENGLLPFAEHKGSGLAFMIEILAGALTGSRCGYNVSGGWGSLFILIDPSMLRPIEEFKYDVESLIAEVKAAPKMNGIQEIFYPGEKSQKERKRNLEAGEFELNGAIYADLNKLLEE